MKKTAPKLELEHVSLEIVNDESPSNPRDEFDNISTFYGPSNSRYLVGGKNDFTLDSYLLENKIARLRKDKSVIVEFSSNAGTCYAVVERYQMQDEYLKFGYSMRKALAAARKCAEGEIETWRHYCEGEVYGYIVKDLEGNHLDSCWGYYGEKYAREEGESMAQYHEAEARKAEKQLEERLAAIAR